MEVKRAVLLGLSRCVQMPTEFLLTGLLWIEVKVGQIIESPSIARVRDTQPAKLNACAVARRHTHERCKLEKVHLVLLRQFGEEDSFQGVVERLVYGGYVVQHLSI